MTESCRLITTEQYQEYLKLKEEHKPLSWNQLKEEAKKMGGTVLDDYSGEEFIGIGKFFYRKSGAIDNGIVYGNISTGRSCEQMLAIMKALN